MTQFKIIEVQSQSFESFSLEAKKSHILILLFCFCNLNFIFNMESLSFYVGVIGNIISVLVFLSPVQTFWRIVNNRSTEEFESLPYICTLLSSSLWTYYGVTKPGSYLVATVNGFGVVVEIIYVSLFLIYAPPRMRAKTALLAGILDVGFLVAAILVTHLAMDGDLRIDVIGFMCAGLNIVMYGSPLAAMKTVVTTKSVEYMPFLLSFFLFLNGGIWTFYAFLVQDWFLGVPNGTGFVLGIAQLVLYAIYRKSKSSKTISDDLESEWQHEHLLPPSGPPHNKSEE
uniref:Bidirectional sugar transporter SWEET n=1 Tax=Davidia involucrata TaxID=16924 RepID=A0A5B7CFP0_DAVIN